MPDLQGEFYEKLGKRNLCLFTMSAMTPKKRSVVINADDLGIHPAVNAGILRAYKEGVVTSTSLMSCGEAFEEGIELLNENPGLGVGVHLTLVEQKPLSDPDNVGSLVDHTGHMPFDPATFVKGWCSGKIRRQDVLQELNLQIKRAIDAGVRPSHFDSHQHIHCLPGIWGIVVELARRHKVPFIRVPKFEAVLSGRHGRAAIFSRASVNIFGAIHRLRWPKEIVKMFPSRGMNSSGSMTPQSLIQILNDACEGITEIMVHPSVKDEDLMSRYDHWRYDWGEDLETVTNEMVIEACKNSEVTLTNFSKLRDGDTG
ncbi:MAG: ChbG/HpnK family deacetylase [Candidatus Lindowbacteria bacterium]|nr:ChbG/HpnK family deacetylase [Candidatus Lindowbacteria bacterium]